MNSPITLMPPIGAPPSPDAWSRILRQPPVTAPPMSRPPGFTYETLMRSAGMPITGAHGMIGSAPDAPLPGFTPSPEAWSRLMSPTARPVGFTYEQLMQSAGMPVTGAPGMIGSAPDAGQGPAGVMGGGADPVLPGNPGPPDPPMPSGNPGGPIIPPAIRNWWNELNQSGGYNPTDPNRFSPLPSNYPYDTGGDDGGGTLLPRVTVTGQPVPGGGPPRPGGHSADYLGYGQTQQSRDSAMTAWIASMNGAPNTLQDYSGPNTDFSEMTPEELDAANTAQNQQQMASGITPQQAQLNATWQWLNIGNPNAGPTPPPGWRPPGSGAHG